MINSVYLRARFARIRRASHSIDLTEYSQLRIVLATIFCILLIVCIAMGD